MKHTYLIILALLFTFLKAQAQNEGDTLFNAAYIHDVHMTFNQVSYWDSLIATHTTDNYIEGTVSIDGYVIGTCGVKTKGNSSFNNSSTKKSFKVDMNEFVSGQNFEGLKKINLNNGFKDPTFLREKLTLDFYQQHGMAAPRCTFARVYLNGIYWGLYSLVEEIDNKTFLDSRFNSSAGNCFKGDPNGDLRWLGATPSLYYPKYELVTNEFLNDWTDLVRLINTISNSGSNFHDSLEAVFNTSSFISQWAMYNVFSNFDSYLGSGHNYYIYHNSITDKFEWMAWDVNESFGTFRQGLTATQILNMSYAYVPTQAGSRPLIQNMIADPVYNNALADTICNWIQYDFSNAALNRKIDSLANVVRTDVYADTRKFYSNQDFETNLTSDIVGVFGLKSFISARRNTLLTELSSRCATPVSTLDGRTNFILYPQPAQERVTIIYPLDKPTMLNVYNSIGSKLLEQLLVNESTEVDLSTLAAGIYFIEINNSVKKLLVQ